jgi:hypothetical protein
VLIIAWKKNSCMNCIDFTTASVHKKEIPYRIRINIAANLAAILC